MKFPQTIDYRAVEARIYGRSKGYNSYRVAYRAGRKRVLRTFVSYAEAKAHAEKKVREIHKGDGNAVLTPKQAHEALAAFRALEDYRRDTGGTHPPCEPCAPALNGINDAICYAPTSCECQQCVCKRDRDTTPQEGARSGASHVM